MGSAPEIVNYRLVDQDGVVCAVGSLADVVWARKHYHWPLHKTFSVIPFVPEKKHVP